jgi:hypothetical protein
MNPRSRPDSERSTVQVDAWDLGVGALGSAAAAVWLIASHVRDQARWLPPDGMPDLASLGQAMVVGSVTIAVLTLARKVWAALAARRGSHALPAIAPGDLDGSAVRSDLW